MTWVAEFWRDYFFSQRYLFSLCFITLIDAAKWMANTQPNPAQYAEDEQQLIEAAQRDPTRFGELFERNADRVYAFIAGRVRNREEAEDLTSEVFHRALKNLNRYEYRGVPFSAWLFRIADNAIAQRGRDAAREAGKPIDQEPVTDADAERRAVLFQLVDMLPEDQQRVIALRYAEQRNLREIADEMQRSEAAVKQLHYRALQNLRQHMEGRK
jgi:RNA polymerase sigma-70 factor (ECF subfamily)